MFGTLYPNMASFVNRCPKWILHVCLSSSLMYLNCTKTCWTCIYMKQYRWFIYCLVFRKKDLYLIITQKPTFMKSGGFQVKSTQNLIKSDVSTKTLQFGGCMEGAMTPDFMKSGVIVPLLHSSN